MDSSEAKEEVKKTADIVEVVGQYVELKKRGQNYVGLCPFHSERSPSFTVNQSKQIYHCFGCGRGGDVFTFWMEYHNLSFPQSLKDLAERYNIALPHYRDSSVEKKKGELKEILLKINHLAGAYFHDVLLNRAEGGAGREYLSSRQIAQETISTFRLGFAANKWDGLVSYLKSKNIPLKRGEEAGLLVAKKGGDYYDRFRGRIMFPIFNLNHQIIGFGGRVLDDSLPKYINTPETPLYHKGSILYGLDSAFKNIREAGLAILVEGYMDLLALRQYGFSNVVATLGTALTSDQMRRLKGYTKNVIVLFDPDEAGREAALKSLPLFLNEGISAKVLVLPQGEDPDSFINTHGPETFRELLKEAKPIFDFYLGQALANMEPGVDGQVRILHKLLPVFLKVEDGATRSLYIHRFSEQTGINEALIWKELRQGANKSSENRNRDRLRKRLSPAQDPRKYGSDEQFLNLLIHYPETVDTFRDQDWELIVFDPEVAKIIRVLTEKAHSGEDLNGIEQTLDSAAAKEQLRRILISKPFYTEESVSQAVSEFCKKIASVKISQSMKKASAEGNIEMVNRLIRAKQDLESKME
ncbi:MAG: DNA primase [Deltaproteobacteria bacterium]|nr:DNA primase [Deltaproteobacteria bacterium]